MQHFFLVRFQLTIEMADQDENVDADNVVMIDILVPVTYQVSKWPDLHWAAGIYRSHLQWQQLLHDQGEDLQWYSVAVEPMIEIVDSLL